MNSKNVTTAVAILAELGLPRPQLNERSAYTLLALAGVGPDDSFRATNAPLIGITPIIDWVRDQYAKRYAPNTRETFRRQTMHQFVEAGLAAYNPDKPDRPVNSPKAVYQLTPEAVSLLRMHGTSRWEQALRTFCESSGKLAERYGRPRAMELVPIALPGGILQLSPGEHSQLIRAIVEEFAPRFAPGSALVYVGDTGRKHGHFDIELLRRLGVTIDNHGKMPDVVFYDEARNWLILAEAVTSHGPVNSKRHGELAKLFAAATAGLVFLTAFPDRTIMARYLPDVAWETEVWVADAPSHLIHFNGDRFLGPHAG
ncbi:MAG: hypothetical protein K2Y17_02975 [Qipengyuania sp.]|nr:hypothetical protein [Qipengyuania sp.]